MNLSWCSLLHFLTFDDLEAKLRSKFSLCALFLPMYIFQHLSGQRLKYGSAFLTEFDFSKDVSENPGFICPRVKSF